MDSSDSIFLNPEGNSRKRVRISRDRDSPTPAKLPNMAAASITEAERSAMGRGPLQDSTRPIAHSSGPCQHEAALNTLNTDIDAMRHTVTCQICHHFMYEPYTLSCGHSYCYSCLSQWLGSNPKKTCPDCRTEIRLQPTPSYVIRELVLIFVGRTQLLADGETSEEHMSRAKEEAETIAKDKADTDPRDGGLFKGIFRPGRLQLPLLPIHDPGDRVDRCPECLWEIEDGYCLQCGVPVGDDLSDFSSDSSDDDVELDLGEHDDDDGLGDVAHRHTFQIDYDGFDDSDEDDEDDMDPDQFDAAFGARPAQVRFAAGGHRRHARTPIAISSDVEGSGSDADSDEDQGSLEDFIDNGESFSGGMNEDGWNSGHSDVSDDSEVQEVAAPPRRPRTQMVIPDDDSDDEVVETGPVPIMSDSDDDVTAVASNRNKRSRRLARPRTVAISSSDEDDEHGTERGAESAAGGFSPLQEGGAFDESGTSDHHEDFEVARDYTTDNSEFGTHHWSESGEDFEAGNSMAPSPYHLTDNEGNGDDGSEDGWGSLVSANRRARNALTSNSGSRAETPDFEHNMHARQEPRHRLQTNNQRRSRHADALALGGSRQSSAMEENTTRRPFPPLRHSTGASRRSLVNNNTSDLPNHPFQLDNTLARLNSANNARHSRDRRTVRSTSAESNESSAGGGADAESLAEHSSSGSSSQTITDAPHNDRKQYPHANHANHNELYGGRGRDAVDEEELDEDEY